MAVRPALRCCGPETLRCSVTFNRFADDVVAQRQAHYQGALVDQLTQPPRDEISVTELSQLSASERRVLDQALLGLTVREIAASLFLTEATIKTHLSHIYEKLGVRSRVDLLARLRPQAAANAAATDKSDGIGRPPAPDHRVPAWALPLAVIVIASGILIGAILAATPGLRTRIAVDDLRSLAQSSAVAEIRIEGPKALARTTDGGEYEIIDGTASSLRQLAIEHEVAYSESPAADGTATVLLMIVSLAPYVLVLGLAWLTWIVIRGARLRGGSRPA